MGRREAPVYKKAMLLRGDRAARRRPWRAVPCFALGLVVVLQPGPARAQRVKEVPVDLDAEEPEALPESPPKGAPKEEPVPPAAAAEPAEPTGTSKPAGDEVIEDPELAGKLGTAEAPRASGDDV